MGKIAGGRRRRGKPSMEKVAETGKLQPRQKQYCDLRLKGYSKKAAGERVNSHPANEQQIKAWEDNQATIDYIKAQGGLPRTIEEGNKLLLQDMFREAILKNTRDIREDKPIDPTLFNFVKEMGERLELEGTGDPVKEKGKKMSFSALVDNLPAETKALIQDKKEGEGEKIKRRKIEVEER